MDLNITFLKESQKYSYTPLMFFSQLCNNTAFIFNPAMKTDTESYLGSERI